MSEYGLMINYEWCSGCRSCELACRNEHGWDLDSYGIKVLELGPFEVDKKYAPIGVDWSYVAVPTVLCDLCSEHVAEQGIPSCQLHCLAGVIEYGKVEDLAKKMVEKGRKINIFIP